MEILIRETTAWQYVIYLFTHYSVSNSFSMHIGLNLSSFPKRCLSGVMMLAYICPLIAQKLTTNCFANNSNTWSTSFFCEDELNTAYRTWESSCGLWFSVCFALCCARTSSIARWSKWVRLAACVQWRIHSERTKGVYLKETMQNMRNDLERSKKPGVCTWLCCQERGSHWQTQRCCWRPLLFPVTPGTLMVNAIRCHFLENHPPMMAGD